MKPLPTGFGTSRAFCRAGLRPAIILSASLMSTWSLVSAGPVHAWQPAEQVETPSPPRIARLIEQLGDRDYFVRQRAQEELARIGAEAFDALVVSENHDDVEIAQRCQYLVRLIQIAWTNDDDPAEVKNLLAGYDSLDQTQRLAVLGQLSALPEGQGLAALCRLVRFEKSQIVSKRAALEIVKYPFDNDEQSQRHRRTIRNSIGSSPRPAAEWLRVLLVAGGDPTSGADAWNKLAEAETQVLRQFPHQTEIEIVMGLWRYQVKLLVQLERRDEAMAAMMKMVVLESGDTETLSELIAWLVEQQAWQPVDAAATRFAERFEQDALLLYTLAQARRAQGKLKLASETADRARGLNEGDQVQHLIVAFNLQKRGLLEWSEREYRLAIEIGPAGQPNTLRSQFLLGELLHDRGDDLPAAEVLQDSCAAMEANRNQGLDAGSAGRDLNTNRSRMHFFFACHYENQKNPAEQVKHLQAAVEEDPHDVDVLIALFRLPDLPPQWRDKTRQLIRQTADEFRKMIAQAPEEETAYNQLAWLIANTEGDQNEALRCSLKSLELRPDSPGYLDTLGRCYFAQGDYQNAVKSQSRAVQLDPHSGQMNKQLALFRKALAESKQKQQQEKHPQP